MTFELWITISGILLSICLVAAGIGAVIASWRCGRWQGIIILMLMLVIWFVVFGGGYQLHKMYAERDARTKQELL